MCSQFLTSGSVKRVGDAPVTLGVSAWIPNSSASLLLGDQYIGSMEEERFIGIKKVRTWPSRAIGELTRSASISSNDIDKVVVNIDPKLFATVSHDESYSQSIIEQRETACREAFHRWTSRINAVKEKYPYASVVGIPHHEAHAMYAFLASGYDQSAIVVLDSVGEVTASSVWLGSRAERNVIRNVWNSPDYSSIGYFYASITDHLGWMPNDEEGTVMALAALGDPSRFRETIKRLIRFVDGSIRVDYALLHPRVRRQRKGFTSRFHEIVSQRRMPGENIEQVHCDLAAAAQQRLEELVSEICEFALKMTGQRKLVLTGGVAENCVANGAVMSLSDLDSIYVPAAPGDSGTALGSAQAAHPQALDISYHSIADPFVGAVVKRAQLSNQFRLKWAGLSALELAGQLSEWLRAGEVIAIVEGRFEFGPRALGNRSLIASAGVPGIVEVLNSSVKKRESFRPFAPVVRLETFNKYFDTPRVDCDLSMMNFAIPANRNTLGLRGVLHANGLVRVQVVSEEKHPLLWHALLADERAGGTGVFINTSLNVKGQPLCGTPQLLLEFANKSKVDKFIINGSVYEFLG
ncbi:carbamoyltransferase C-terminal domain-containing protein [Gulosibacter hominis]|uniref:carbamoyltransferase C-terminal domain-containing protein n=1 Tax=Gulosibacter hominis TaxID=2770504 RepID=UPI001E449DA0|nr:carbamoyltransferase C-terminal domain-containing protein [Gulosibacter hominis]